MGSALDIVALIAVLAALLPAFGRTPRGVGLLSLVYLGILFICIPLANRAVSETSSATLAAGLGALFAGAISLLVFTLTASIRWFVLARRAKRSATPAS